MMKKFNLPINDERVQNITLEQLDFMIACEEIDNEKINKNSEYYYDPDFDKEFENLDSQEEGNLKSYLDNDIDDDNDFFEV